MIDLKLSHFPNELNAGQATVFLTLATGDLDRNWDNVLRENRRSSAQITVKGEFIRKGNRHRLEHLPFVTRGSKVIYKKTDLYTWAHQAARALPVKPASQNNNTYNQHQNSGGGSILGLLAKKQEEYRRERERKNRVAYYDKILKQIEAI